MPNDIADPIAVTGMGCVCPLGNDSTMSNIQYLSGTSAIKNLEDTWEGCDRNYLCSTVSFDFKSALGGFLFNRLDRCTHMALVAAKEAWNEAAVDRSGVESSRISVVIGTGMGGQSKLLSQVERHLTSKRLHPLFIPMVIPNTTSAQISIEFGCTGGAHTLTSACASGSEAISFGCQLLSSYLSDIVIVGGTESPINALCLKGFDEMRALAQSNGDVKGACRPFASNRNGFVLGEGAGILILERLNDARARKVDIKGKILGSGMTNDAYHLASPLGDGTCSAQAISKALLSAGLQSCDVDMISAHATGTALGDLAEANAINKVFDKYSDSIPVTAPKAGLGHLLGASGAVETILTINALRNGFIAGSLNSIPQDPRICLNIPQSNIKIDSKNAIAVKNNFAFGGHNVSLVLTV